MCSRHAVISAHGLAVLGVGHHAENLPATSRRLDSPFGRGPAMNPDRHLASAAQRGQSGPLRRDGKPGGGVVKKRQCCHRRPDRPAASRFPANPVPPPGRSLSGSSRWRTHSVFSSRSRPAAASRIASTCPSASLRRRVSTLPRNSTASTSGRSSLSCARRRWLLVPTFAPAGSEATIRVLHRHENIARIDAGRRCRQRKPGRQLGGQILERMHGQVHAALGQRLFDFLGEHALRADLRKRHFLQPVAGGLDDLDFDRVPCPRSRSAMWLACQRASCEPRLPMRRFIGAPCHAGLAHGEVLCRLTAWAIHRQPSPRSGLDPSRRPDRPWAATTSSQSASMRAESFSRAACFRACMGGWRNLFTRPAGQGLNGRNLFRSQRAQPRLDAPQFGLAQIPRPAAAEP